ncbi:MAG: hypothetical protein QXI22_08725 [Sulfolobales archaeon]
MRGRPRKNKSRQYGLVLFIFLIASLAIYLANIKIPIAYVEKPNYRVDLYRGLNISVERIAYNIAYPGVNSSTVSMKLLVGEARVSIDNIPFSPGREVRPAGGYVVVNVSGQGPWNIYVYDDHLGRDLLVGVIYRSTDLVVQTGMYTALLSVALLTDLSIKISQGEGMGAKLLLRYDNRSEETIDLGVCGGDTCIYRIQRTDLVGYELSFYRRSWLVYARVTDGLLAIYPWDNPYIFIAIPIAIIIAMIYLLQPRSRPPQKKRRVRKY